MNTNIFTTKDWIEAALLLAYRLRLTSTHNHQGICFFNFDDRSKADELLESYLHGDLTVNLREFVDSQRRIKDLIHRQNNGYGNRKHEPSS